MKSETWREVIGYPSYLVSTFGNVRSLYRGKDRLLKPGTHYHGYKIVWLYSKESKHKKMFIHRLVAEAFIPNPDAKPFVNHIDCNKENNLLSNLEWMTESENSQWYHKNKVAVDDGCEF